MSEVNGNVSTLFLWACREMSDKTTVGEMQKVATKMCRIAAMDPEISLGEFRAIEIIKFAMGIIATEEERREGNA